MMNDRGNHDGPVRRGALLDATLTRRGVGGLAVGVLAAVGLVTGADAVKQRSRKSRRKRNRGRPRAPQLSFQFVTAWGSEGNGNAQFNGPRGIATDSKNNVYAVDADNNRIQTFTRTGVFLAAWGSEGDGNGQFEEPQFIAIGPDDSVYVTAIQQPRVQKFTSDGTFVTAWGSGGTCNGQFGAPAGIAVDSSNTVYVADSRADQIKKFTPA